MARLYGFHTMPEHEMPPAVPGRPSAYISGPLHASPNLDRARRFYELLAKACMDAGWTAYLPHLRTDPELHATITPREVFDTDVAMLSGATAVVADVGVPSSGVGGELVLAWKAKKPIVAVHTPNETVSRFVRGLLAAAEATIVVYSDPDDCARQVATALRRLSQTGSDLR